MLRFTLYYIVYMLLLFTLLVYQNIIDIQLLYSEFINSFIVALLNIFGMNAFYSGSNILLPTSILIVEFGCSGLEAIAIFMAAVLAYHSTWSTKVHWLLIGIVILMVVNIFRLLTLVYVLEYQRSFFNLMHDYVTQDMMIFVSMMIFFLFIQNDFKGKRL